MIKRPCNAEDVMVDWISCAIKKDEGKKVTKNREPEVVNRRLPSLYAEDEISDNSRSIDRSNANSTDRIEKQFNETVPSNSNAMGRERRNEIVDGPKELTMSGKTDSREVDKLIMDVPCSTLCFEPQKERFCQEAKHSSLGLISTSIRGEKMHPDQAQNVVSKEIIENYCRTMNELEICKEEVSSLRRENRTLVDRLKEFRGDVDSYRHTINCEKNLREKIQNDLRKLVDEMENYRPETWSTTHEATSCITEADIEYYKDQFRIYQEDFKQEKAEKLKLRELNSLLTTELEEAKRTIESQQKKLLVYAQIFSNGSGTSFVIPPAYIGRRVHSNPSSPSYTQYHKFGRERITELDDSLLECTPRKPSYDPIFDIVPKGCAPSDTAEKPSGRRISATHGELKQDIDDLFKRDRSNSIEAI